MNLGVREVLASALFYVIAFAILGCALTVAGVVMVAGPGWALVLAGIYFAMAAWFISKGLKQNG